MQMVCSRRSGHIWRRDLRTSVFFHTPPFIRILILTSSASSPGPEQDFLTDYKISSHKGESH